MGSTLQGICIKQLCTFVLHVETQRLQTSRYPCVYGGLENKRNYCRVILLNSVSKE